MQKPDRVSPMTAIEEKMGIVSVESLLAERDSIIKELAPLRARHGPGGSYDDLRKNRLAKAAELVRLRAAEQGQSLTQAEISDKAHADPGYEEWLNQMTQEKVQYLVKQDVVDGIQETLMRGNVVGRFISQEVGLAR